MSAPTEQFPRDTSGLPAATPSELVELAEGERFQLRIAPVTKQLGDASVRMLAYNGSIPGPTLRVLEHRTPEKIYRLGGVTVTDERAEPSLTEQYQLLRRDLELTAERERVRPWLDAEPDKTLAFVAEMEFDAVEGPAVYVCPMHPEVVAEEPGHCPSCGMKLLPSQLVAQAGGHEHHEHGTPEDATHAEQEDAAHGHHDHDHAATGGIEWEDDMVDVNRITTPANTRWKLIDRSDDAANHAIAWQFTVGDRVKIRLVNEMDSDHPMHHPFHIHGAGRFLVLARDGEPERNLVWSDTVLVRTGEVVDILLDVTNPGRWMAHCHIAEHHESGMMFSFDVAPAEQA